MYVDQVSCKNITMVMVEWVWSDLEAADGEEDVGRRRRKFEPCTQHGLQVGLVACLSETCHLPSTGHLHSCSMGMGV